MQIQQGGVYKIENALVWKESDSEEIAFSFFSGVTG